MYFYFHKKLMISNRNFTGIKSFALDGAVCGVGHSVEAGTGGGPLLVRQRGRVEGEDRVRVQLGRGDRPHGGEVTAASASNTVATRAWYQGVRRV